MSSDPLRGSVPPPLLSPTGASPTDAPPRFVQAPFTTICAHFVSHKCSTTFWLRRPTALFPPSPHPAFCVPRCHGFDLADALCLHWMMKGIVMHEMRGPGADG